MSGLYSRSKRLLPVSKPLTQTTNEETCTANSDRGKPSPSTPYSKKDDLGFLELAPGSDPAVDIIAIHGLDGHREKTWTTDEEVLWLRDLLPSDLPNARILTYGYDADTRSGECVSTQTICRHADGFAQALLRIRKDTPRRPIIFIAHGLGGIILKWALVICHNQNLESKGDLRDTLVSTHGILFFGTPHSGLEGTTLLTAINQLASVYMKTTDVILKDLQSHSSELENIQRLYVAASEKIKSIFFCEEYQTPVDGKRRKMNVPHHSAVIAGDRNATTIVLHADHEGLVRFSAAESDNYRTVYYYLNDYVEKAPAAVAENWVREDRCREAAKGEPALREVVRAKARPPVSRSYIERAGVECLITQKLLPSGPVKRQPRCVLHGLGGAGKTQLATNWIQEHESSFSRVIVVDASSQAQLEADLELSIRSIGPEYSKMTWKDAVAYLDGKEKGWLLFLDNADSPGLDLRPYLPTSTHGSVVITTRNRECTDYAPDGAVPVGGLEEKEAVNLLHAVSGAEPTSDAMSLEIVRELGMLALAITQAGAYICKTRRLDKYLETFRSHRDQLLRKKPGRGTDYTLSTYAAFDLSFSQLPAETQELLKVFAFLYHSTVPVALFEQATLSGFSAYTVRTSCSPGESDNFFISILKKTLGVSWNEILFQEIVDSASSASFIDISSDGSSYSVHPLFQAYIKDSLGEDETRRYIRTTSQLLLGAIRPLEGSNAVYWRLLPHVNRISRSVQSENIAHALAFHLLYDSLGDWKACRELLESALSQLVSTRGEKDEDSLWLMGNLAKAMHECGQLDAAEKMQRKVLALRLEILGERHPDIISVINELSLTLRDRGELAKAEKMQREALDLRIEILGPRDLHTISSMANLAAILYRRGRLEEAETMQREVLTLRIETLQGLHPDTISAMTHLAATLYERGQLDKAEELERKALALRLEILGERHPDTISAMINLASTLYERGQLDDAEKMEREALGLQLEILGERHPDTISAMANLANTLYKCGALDDAEKMQRAALSLRLEILGERHPDTILVTNDLARTLCSRGQLDSAEKMQREVLALQLEILGGRHLDTIWTMADLANTLFERGQLDEAEKMGREVLALRLEILGRRHPDTISALATLENTLSKRGQLDESEKMEREVLALQFGASGGRHASPKYDIGYS